MLQEKIKTVFQKAGKGNWLFAAGLAGIVLIGLSGLLGSGKTAQTPAQTASAVTTEEYARSLEEQLETMLSRIRNAGACRVMVTMEQGVEYVYATGEKNSVDISETSEEKRFSTGNRTSGEETYIMVSTKEGEQPLLLTELAPRVKGVVVICAGAENAAVAETVRQAAATALDISVNRICVVPGD